jgi:hypothetical protein
MSAFAAIEIHRRMSSVGTKPPIWNVLATVAIGGNPDMTKAAQSGRE